MQLTNEDIQKLIQDINNFLQKSKVSKRDCTKICLIVEESLILYRENFGIEHELQFITKKSFGVPKIIIRVKGEQFTLKSAIDIDNSIFNNDVMQKLLHYQGAQISYRYFDGCNEIHVLASKEKKKFKIPGGTITLIAIAALLCGIFCRYLPIEIQNTIINQFADPLTKTSMDLIVAVTGPFIFISVISGICVMDDISTLNEIGVKVIKRFLSITVFVSIAFTAVSQIFFPVIELNAQTSFDVSQLISLLLQIIPTNLFTPFTEGKVLQIVLIAVLIGICILILGDHVSEVKKFVSECDKIIFKMMDLVSKIIYVAIFFSIFKIIVTSNLQDVLSSWKIIAVNYITLTLICMLMLIRLSIKYKINVSNFLKKLSKVLAISFSTASNTAAMSTNINVLKDDLKINSKLCDFWIPLSHSMFSPSAAGALILSVFFCAYMSSESISPVNLLIAIFLSMQLSIATPPVPGGIMAIYAIILAQLNISSEAIGLLIMSNVFIVNFSSVTSMLIRDCELMDFSHQVNFKD